MDSIWMDERPDAPARLQGRLDADVVVVGAGITGLATAWRLAASGVQVVVLEARGVGGGNTGRSTGNLYDTVSTGLAGLLDKWKTADVQLAVSARAQAIAWIEDVARELGIDCGLRRVPLHQCVLDPQSPKLQELREEHEAALRLGLPAQWAGAIDGWPLEAAGVHSLPGQAHFNPYRFCVGLARALRDRGVAVHEHSGVVEVDPGGNVVVTAEGRVRAGHIVLATHTPLGVNLLQTKMEVYREYGVAGPVEAPDLPAASVWVQDRGRSVRTHDVDGLRHLVIVGEKHKTGENGAEPDHPGRLREFGVRHFGMDRFSHGWSAQQYRSADGLPYIGRSGHRNVLVATGMGADGLVWGTVAGEVIGSIVLHDREDALGELLSPRRLAPLKSAKGFAAENATVAKHMVSDRIKARAGTPDDVAPGDGEVMRVEGDTCAVHRTVEGELLVLSADGRVSLIAAP